MGKEKYSRKYHPDRILKPSGVHSFYLGQDGDPLVEIFDSYCKIHQTTFSHGVRSILEDFFRAKQLLDESGETTEKYPNFRKQAEKARRQQKELLEMGIPLKPKRNRRKKT